MKWIGLIASTGLLAVSAASAQVSPDVVTIVPRAAEVSSVGEAIVHAQRQRMGSSRSAREVGPGPAAPGFDARTRPGYPAEEPPTPGSE